MGTNSDRGTIPLCRGTLTVGSSTSVSLTGGRVRRVGDDCRLSGVGVRRRQRGGQVHLVFLTIVVIILFMLFVFVFHLTVMQGTLGHSRGRVHGTTTAIQRAGRVGGHFLSGVDCGVHAPLGGMMKFSRLVTYRPGVSRKAEGRCSGVVRRDSRGLVELIGSILSLSHLRTRVVGFRVRICSTIRLYGRTYCVTHVGGRAANVRIQFCARAGSRPIHASATHLARVVLDALICPCRCRRSRGRRHIVHFVLDQGSRVLRFRVVGSPLTSAAFISRRAIVQRRVGRLLLARFKKACRVGARAPRNPRVIFACPVTSSSRWDTVFTGYGLGHLVYVPAGEFKISIAQCCSTY